MTIECEESGSYKETPTKTDRKEKMASPPTKVVIRKLPPSFTEEEFLEVVSPLPEHSYFYFAVADKRLGPAAFSRAYINFVVPEDVIMFRNMYDSYVFVDQKGDEYPAIVEYAPFQKIPKHAVNPTKDPRCGTIEEDPDYIAFLESLDNPETVSLPHMEQVVEEIEAKDRELRANHGVLKVKTPLLEFIEKRQSEKQLQLERRKKKEAERRKAKEEEKKRRKEQFNKKEEVPKKKEGKSNEKNERRESSKISNDQEEKPGRSKKFTKEFTSTKYKKETGDEPRGKRYSEARKQSERKVKDSDDKTYSPKASGKSLDTPKSKASTKKSDKEHQRDSLDQSSRKETGAKNGDRLSKKTFENKEEKEKLPSKVEKKDQQDNSEVVSSKSSETKNEKRDAQKERIRNKDRPAMQLYRPGQNRLRSRVGGEENNAARSDSSSCPSPVESVGKEPTEKRCKEIQSSNNTKGDERKEYKKSFSNSQYKNANKRDGKGSRTMTFERSLKPK